MNEDRKQAFILLHDILTEQKFANLTLKTGLNGFSERDKAFICSLVYGTLDKLIALDYVLSLYAKGRLQPKVRDLLRLGAYQILYMDRVPDSAAVNTTVSLAQEIGKGALKAYINGVLRSVSREKERIPYPSDPAESLSVRYAYPRFLVEEFLKTWGREKTEAFLACEGSHETCLRVDPNKADAARIREQLGARPGIFFDECCYISGQPRYLENGVCSVQSEASYAAVRALCAKPGERVLDMCAAPGGKTVAIASMMKTGSIVACDRYPHRVELIRKNALRCGYDGIIEPLCADMTKERGLGRFDRVLLDAPCSGLGVTGQKPEIKLTITPETCAAIEQTQAQLLTNAARCVKPGGVLVYSTCTVRPSENENQIRTFLKRETSFALESIKGLPERMEKGVDDGMLQLLPYRDNTDGFFIARMRKH